MIPNRSQEAIKSRLEVSSYNISDKDDMEIVIVSDTVRQRRSRTPSSSSTTLPNDSPNTKESKANAVSMPDVLPQTFHLAEKSTLFSQANNMHHFLARKQSIEGCEQKVSVVEVREASLSTPKRVINTYQMNDRFENQNVGQVLNMCSILESVSYLKPSCVETVHIIDATSEPSDTETRCSTPNFDDRKLSSSDDGESDEYETGEPASHSNNGTMQILKRQISFDENRQSLLKDRDFLKDSEQNDVPPKLHRKRLTPTLKDILSMTMDRDSFYSDDKEADDEPLIFSDDDDYNRVDGQPTELRFNRHTVLINIKKRNKQNKKHPHKPNKKTYNFCLEQMLLT